jgi:hypothetical protein
VSAPRVATKDEQAREVKAYDAASNLFRRNDFRAAIDAFRAFLKDYPESQLAANAGYWIGICYANLRDYRNALTAQQDILTRYPNRPRCRTRCLRSQRSSSSRGDNGRRAQHARGHHRPVSRLRGRRQGAYAARGLAPLGRGVSAAVVLVSGGLDSATVLAMAVARGCRCHALSVDYGQRHRAELAAAAQVARSLGAASHRVVTVDLGAFGGSALTDSTIEVPRSPAPGIPGHLRSGAQHHLPGSRPRPCGGDRIGRDLHGRQRGSTIRAIPTAAPSSWRPSSAWPTSRLAGRWKRADRDRVPDHRHVQG